MKNLKKGELKKDVYEEEIIRIDFIAGDDFKKNENDLIVELAKIRV